MFGRGHLDHFALGMADAESFEEARERLVRAGASDGMVTDFGSVRSVFFVDPDGFEAEIALWQDGPTRTFEDRLQIPYGEGAAVAPGRRVVSPSDGPPDRTGRAARAARCDP